jgi:hypothetical protein
VVDTTGKPTNTVRFGRRQSRGLLLGFSGQRISAIAAALVVFVIAISLSGVVGATASAPVWGGLIAAAFVPWGGRTVIETLPTAAHFGVRRLVEQDRYRVKPSKPRPAGTMALPGDAAALRFHVDESGAVMVHDPHEQTLTAVARLTHPAFVLLSPDSQQQRVTAWGRILAGLSASGSCVRLQVLESALPDSGQGITDWWNGHGSTDPDQWAVREYEQLMRTAAPAASTHRTLVALVLDMKRAAKQIREAGRGIAGAAALLRQDMTAFETSVTAADLHHAGWLDDARLARVIRSAYDPVTADTIDGQDVGQQLSTAGPVGVQEHWGHLRHDSGYSTVLWISEWPRIEVGAWFLHSLIFEQGVRKTFSLVVTPLSTAQAMREIRKQKVEYVTDAAQKARIGQLADLADSQEYQDVLDRERALIAGHADLTFNGFVAVTAPDLDRLQAAVSQVERAALRSGCETRVLCGQQAQAFTVAALPLGRKAA